MESNPQTPQFRGNAALHSTARRALLPHCTRPAPIPHFRNLFATRRGRACPGARCNLGPKGARASTPPSQREPCALPFSEAVASARQHARPNAQRDQTPTIGEATPPCTTEKGPNALTTDELTRRTTWDKRRAI